MTSPSAQGGLRRYTDSGSPSIRGGGNSESLRKGRPSEGVNTMYQLYLVAYRADLLPVPVSSGLPDKSKILPIDEHKKIHDIVHMFRCHSETGEH